MTPRPRPRHEPCGRPEAVGRLAQADAYLAAATLVVDDESDPANPGVAAALAVLAGIAGADAACCARLKTRSRGQDHRQATALVATVDPHGAEMAKDLDRLLAKKDTVHYGTTIISATEGARMVSWAKRLVAHAHLAVRA